MKTLLWIVGILVVIGLIVSSHSPTPTVVSGTEGDRMATWILEHPEASQPVQSPAEMAAARKDYAAIIDHEFLAAAIESRTVATGTTLTIHCAAASRVFAERITNEKLGGDFSFDRMKTLGFKKLVLTDDDDARFTWDVAKN